MKASFAFLIHPLAPWQRRLLGVRFRDVRLLSGNPSDAVRRVATLRVETALGSVVGHIIGVPDLPDGLVANQSRALELQVRAAAIAERHGAGVIGLGSALAVVAGRGAALAEHTAARITTGHAATAWAATELVRQAAGSEPVGVLGFSGTVGDAVAARLAAEGDVWVEATTAAAQRRAKAIGCHPAERKEVLAKCRVVVGASTTGPDLPPGALSEGTVLVDLANPATLEPGPRPAGVVVLAGETLAWPGRVHGRVWGRLWRAFAGYERGTAYACLAEPIAAIATDSEPWSAGRRLDPAAVDAAGAALTRIGFRPILTARRD